ncbi:MAG: hypothetical protein U0V48_14035 [Anaerolineales bacterium]
MGINLISLLWTHRKAYALGIFVCIIIIDGLTKNDHFQNMLHSAQERGFTPELVVFDSWYSSLENLKNDPWFWLALVDTSQENRLVSLGDWPGNRQVSDWLIPSQGQKCDLKGYIDQKVFKTVAKTAHLSTGQPAN